MTRHSIAQTAISPFSSIEAAIRLTLRRLTPSPAFVTALAELEMEQSRIRATGRHWLLG